MLRFNHLNFITYLSWFNTWIPTSETLPTQEKVSKITSHLRDMVCKFHSGISLLPFFKWLWSLLWEKQDKKKENHSLSPFNQTINTCFVMYPVPAWQGGWRFMILDVPSNPAHPVILWFCIYFYWVEKETNLKILWDNMH